MEKVNFRKVFRDVVRGYSSTLVDDEIVYIKHLSPHDQVELEEIEEKYFNIAKKKGVPTEKDMLDHLSGEGMWTKKDDDFIDRKKIYIENMKQALGKLLLDADLDRQRELIEKETKLLREKQGEKARLVGNTCEKYARDRLSDFYIINSFYRDKEMQERLYTQDEFDDLEQINLKNIITIYNDSFNIFSEKNIQHTIISDFYNPYIGFAENSMQFYGKPFCELTYNQVRLLVFTRIYKNIFESNENIPESIRKDPEKLLEFGTSSKEERDKVKEKLSKGDGGTIVGAKEADYERLGIKNAKGTVSLHEAAKKKGGSLNMEDLMKLHGVK